MTDNPNVNVDASARAAVVACDQRLAAAYDAVARRYAQTFADELDEKPLERVLLGMIGETASAGRLADVGCGPGHVTRFLCSRHPDVIGVDISPRMISLARQIAPHAEFSVGSLLSPDVPDDSWLGAVALYSLIHFAPELRAQAIGELARVLTPGGSLLAAVHVDGPHIQAGDHRRITSFLGAEVDLDGYFIEPEALALDVEQAGLRVEAVIERRGRASRELASRRCYLLAKKAHPRKDETNDNQGRRECNPLLVDSDEGSEPLDAEQRR